MGQFILTGSTVPFAKNSCTAAPGRISNLRMRTMNFFESGESSGEVSLGNLFKHAEPEGTAKFPIESLTISLARGGWPASIGLSDKAALAQVGKYLNAIVDNDVFELQHVQRNPRKIRLLIRSLARNIATMASIETYAKMRLVRQADPDSD